MLQRAGSDAGKLADRFPFVNTDQFCSFIDNPWYNPENINTKLATILFIKELVSWWTFHCPAKLKHFLLWPEKKLMRNTYRLSPTICSVCAPEVFLEAIFRPVMSTAVGCCSDKLAWIKCQPLSRFSLPGATVNLFTREQVRKSRYEREIWKIHKLNRWKDETLSIDLPYNSSGIDEQEKHELSVAVQ